jgi:N-acetylmuramoyl-L-alanine amidase
LLCMADAEAQTASFSGVLNGQQISASVTVVTRNGIPYVPLARLADQFGAGFSESVQRTQVDLGGQTAWLQSGSTEVYGSLSKFSLSHRVEDSTDGAMMAVPDVASFFMRCFRLSLQRSDMTDEAPSTLDDDMELALMDLAPVTDLAGLRSPPQPNPISRVVIDPGHGGGDAGAVGPSGLTEKDLTLAVALHVKTLLESEGAMQVLLTRTEDVELSSDQRGAIATRFDSDLFISLHGGASRAAGAPGIEIFYSSPRPMGGAEVPRMRRRDHSTASRALAEAIAPDQESGGTLAARGIRQAPLRILKGLDMPGVLIELGSMTNPTEETLLQTTDYQRRLAQAVVDGLGAFATPSNELGP